MEFRILGPLEVSDEGGQVSLGGGKPRALLAVLLLHPNEVVSADRLIDELWGEDSPERAAAALRVNVSRLRKALPQDVLATRSPGYVDPGRARRARSPPIRAAGGRGEELARPRPAGRRVGAATRGAVAVEGPGARGLRLRELRPDGDRPARGDQAGSGRAPDRRRPRTRAPRRAGRGARGTRRRAPAPRTSEGLSDDGAVPVGSAGGGPGRLQGCAPGPRRRARDRTEYCAPGAGAGDPSAGAGVEPPSDGARVCRRGGGAVDSRRYHARGARRRAARGGRAACARPASHHDPGQARVGRSRASVGVSLARGAPVCTRGARCRGPCGLVHVDGAGRGAGSARHRARRRSPARRRPRRAPGRGSSRRAAHRRTCGDALRRGAARSSGRDARGPRPRPVRRGRARLGGGRARRVVRARRAMRRSGSQVPPQCRSTAGATRAACFRTAPSRSSGSWASRPSRCWPRRAKRACWRRAATPVCSSSGCRRGGTARASARPASDSPERPPRPRCSSAGVYAPAASLRRPR